MQFFISIIIAFLFTIQAHAGNLTEESLFIINPTKEQIKTLKQNPEISFDHPSRLGIEVYGPKGLSIYLNQLDINFVDIALDHLKNADDYPTPEKINEELEKINEEYPEITQLDVIGISTQGKKIYAMKISDQPNVDENEPEVKYIANMHGDEIVGRELMILLIKELTSQYRNGNAQVKNLIDQTEIYIIPSMNPDGAYDRRRGNSSWVDLNRDFPDFSTRDNENTPHGREVETKAIMEWQASRNFSLSANFHGGAEVVNYPWDTIADRHPLHDFVVQISQEYANEVPGMKNSIEFPGGIVNGYSWYEVNGGMQDWSYYWYNDLQVTIEVSNVKWPRYSEVARYWEENKKSLVNFLEKVHQGVGFVIKSEIKKVQIAQNDTLIGTFEVINNEFYKVLPIGEYTFNFLTEENKIVKTIKKSVIGNGHKAVFETI